MKRILIAERSLQSLEQGYDHVFSFSAGQAHSFADDYVTPEEVQSLYDVVYDAVCERLKDPSAARSFSYREVNLLWCFKKELFHSAYWVALKWEVLRRVVEKFPGGHFYIYPGTGKSNSSRFADILARVPTAMKSASFHELPVSSETKNVRKSSRACVSLSSIWPRILSFGRLSHCRTAVFSDYARSRSVLQRLAPGGCAVFSNTPSPRTVFRALNDGASLFQISYDKKGGYREEIVRKFIGHLREAKIFSDVVWTGLNAEPFLQQMLEQLFAEVLPRLLFEIDAAHRFFQRASRMRAVLLDEDIDPCKNAFCQVARQYNVKTFVELHGALGARHGLIPLTADKIFVWGQAQKNRLIRWGCPADRIIVSGCSRYGYYQKLDASGVKMNVARRAGLDPKRKIVLIAFAPISRWHAWYERRMWRVIGETLAVVKQHVEESQAQFIIKLHPADENERFYRDWVASNHLEGHVVVIKKYDPMLLAKAADFLIVYGSTYAVDGFALGKPVICLEDFWDPLLEEYREYSVFLYANSKNDLYDFSRKLLGSEISKSDSQEKAREACLNQKGEDPEAFIASQLTHV